MRLRTFFVLAIVVREVFSFWTGHPYDFELWVRTGFWVVRGVSPYGFVPPAPGVSFVDNISAGGNPTIAYLPFWPLLLGGLYEVYALLGSVSPFVYYFLIKQPIIVCDVLLGYFLYRFLEARSSNKASFVLKVWLFSPFNILLSGIWGMFDAIPLLFLILALTARPGAYRGVWAGLATFAKSIPLIYAIPLARGPNAIRNLALALGIPVVASLAIIWFAGWPFSVFGTTLQSTLSKGGLSLSLWEALFYLYSINAISNSVFALYASAGYVWVSAVAIATVLAYRWFGFDTERGIVRSLLLVTLTFLLLRGEVAGQYATYLFALTLIDVALWSPQRKSLFVASLALILMAAVTNDVLFIRFLAPVYPQALVIERNIIEAIDPVRNALLFLEAMGFCAVNMYYFYALFKERHIRTEDPLLLP